MGTGWIANEHFIKFNLGEEENKPTPDWHQRNHFRPTLQK
jgi:hypothetical protein